MFASLAKISRGRIDKILVRLRKYSPSNIFTQLYSFYSPWIYSNSVDISSEIWRRALQCALAWRPTFPSITYPLKRGIIECIGKSEYVLMNFRQVVSYEFGNSSSKKIFIFGPILQTKSVKNFKDMRFLRQHLHISAFFCLFYCFRITHSLHWISHIYWYRIIGICYSKILFQI